LEEEHGGEEGAFFELDKVNKANVADRLKQIEGDKEVKDEATILNEWLNLATEEAALKKSKSRSDGGFGRHGYAKLPKLTEAEIKTLVVDDRMARSLHAAIHSEMDRISLALTYRVKERGRYETPIPQMVSRVAALEAK